MGPSVMRGKASARICAEVLPPLGHGLRALAAPTRAGAAGQGRTDKGISRGFKEEDMGFEEVSRRDSTATGGQLLGMPASLSCLLACLHEVGVNSYEYKRLYRIEEQDSRGKKWP